MKRWERWSFNLASLVIAITGFAYFWMKYLLTTDDPFAVVNHPWQGLMLQVHVLAAPLFILVFGIVLNSHVMKKLRASKLPNRKTGYTSLATFALMVASGYLLQIASSDAWLQGLVAVHVASGAIFSLVYAGHLVASVRLARRQPTAIREVA
jgi:hypothetical protein